MDKAKTNQQNTFPPLTFVLHLVRKACNGYPVPEFVCLEIRMTSKFFWTEFSKWDIELFNRMGCPLYIAPETNAKPFGKLLGLDLNLYNDLPYDVQIIDRYGKEWNGIYGQG